MAETPISGRSFSGHKRQGVVVTDDSVSAWFVREILPFEGKLVRYLQHHWRNADDIPDLRQEVYARVFEAIRERIPDNPRNFLMVCARNLLIDQVRRGQVVPMETFSDFDALGLMSEAPEPDSMVIKRDEIRRLQAALALLPPRTREAIVLACEGLTATEIAKRMGVAQPTASRFLAKGTLALANILYGRAPGSERS